MQAALGAEAHGHHHGARIVGHRHGGAYVALLVVPLRRPVDTHDLDGDQEPAGAHVMLVLGQAGGAVGFTLEQAAAHSERHEGAAASLAHAVHEDRNLTRAGARGRS